MPSTRLLTSILAVALCVPGVVAARRHRDPPGGWRLDVRRDTFSGGVRCTLTSADRRVRVDHGGAGFRFSPRRDTLAAWYRVDDGATVRWQDRYPTLIAADVPVDGPSLANPTDGMVWIPLAGLAQARTVTIRPDARRRPATFAIAGLAATVATADARGCTFAGGPRR